ncbi:Re/Si-specific NAD(P)(+) transhydrogenase subunit alpha [bacterium]|nr:Re/Si-specific NAD(P)(+) transhydrogenase subunit alpha [bacterium]MCI0603361.1 Re/Si-specific NAD(P)(+) transhydrogenase subunit alpha [bacterium]
MKIGIPKETAAGETRVAMYPALVSSYTKDKHEVLVERDAGQGAAFSDEMYSAAGARILPDAKQLNEEADIILKVQPSNKKEAEQLREGTSLIGFLSAFTNHETVRIFAARKITAYAMEMIPRITRAQSMDALSSMATVAGYKSVLLAADHIHKMFPLMMTAAGTITPATVLILGAGVAGLQAIATARRLGAKVEAFDPRPAVKEQVKSLGAMFVEMEMPADAETAGGYAKELSPEFIQKEMEAIGGRLPKVDVVICTAQVFGKKAPLLITADMVKMLRAGSIIVDLAAEQGGNCELTEAGITTTHNGVKIIGAVNLPATMPLDASQLYSRNVQNLFRHLYPKADAVPDFTDEITRGCCVTRDGQIVNDAIRNAVGS